MSPWDKQAQCDVDIERLSVKCRAVCRNSVALQVVKARPVMPGRLLPALTITLANIFCPLRSIIDVSVTSLEELLASMWIILQEGVRSDSCKGSCINNLTTRMNSCIYSAKKGRFLSQIHAGDSRPVVKQYAEMPFPRLTFREPSSSCITTFVLHWRQDAAQTSAGPESATAQQRVPSGHH